MSIAELTGYLASVLLAVSLVVNNDLRFRWINSLGCAAFIIYGILIKASPIILTNAILMLINVVYLVRIYRADEDFDLIEFDKHNKLIEKFFSFYRDDISSYFPALNILPDERVISFAVLRNMAIANVFIASVDDKGNAWVKINYTVPKYRDFKVGRYLLENQRSYFVSKGVNRMVYHDIINKNHEHFLKIMGFKKSHESGITYAFQLTPP